MGVNMSTKTSSSTLREYIDRTGELPTDVLLGRIVFNTITDTPVAHSDLEQWFDDLNLNKDLLPFPIKEVHAFKKATSEIDGHKYPMSNGCTAHMLTRDVTATPDFVRRQITREVQDSKKKRLFYNGAIEATFYRGNGTIGSARIKLHIKRDEVKAEELDPLREVAADISARYHRHVFYHDGQKMRSMVRDYLKYLNAIEIKGGTYFCHTSKDQELAGLSALVNRLGGGCKMKTIPLLDLVEEREFIASVFEREAAQSLQEVSRDIKAALSSGKVTGPAFAKLKARYDEILGKAEEHMFNLGVTQDMTAAAAEVALLQLTKLQEMMIA